MTTDNDLLEYRPNWEWEEKEIGGFPPDNTEQYHPDIPEDEKDIGDGLLTDEVGNLVDNQEEINDLKGYIKELLDGFVVPVSDELKDSLIKSKDDLGLSSEEGITLEDYENALKHIKTPPGAFIVELWEDYMEDVNGSLEGEVYGDLVELEQEGEQLLSCVQFFCAENVQSEQFNFKETSWSEKMLAFEKEHKKQRIEKNTAYTEANRHFYHALTVSIEEKLTAKAEKQATKLDNLKTRNLDNELRTLNNLLHYENNATKAILNKMTVQLKDKKEVDKEIIIESINLSSMNDKQKALTKGNVMLKLAVDLDNKEKHRYKNQLRNIYDIEKREKLFEEQKTTQGLYDHLTLELSHQYNTIENRLPEGPDAYLTQVAKGLSYAFEQKNQLAKEFYSVTTAASRLRKMKLENVYDKNQARIFYQTFS